MPNPYASPLADPQPSTVERRVQEAMEARDLLDRIEKLERSARRWKWITVGLSLAVLGISYAMCMSLDATMIEMYSNLTSH